MKRREWLKILAGGTAGMVAARSFGQSMWSPDMPIVSTAFYVVTESWGKTFSKILTHKGILDTEFLLEDHRIPPTRQDLTLIRNGAIIDPTDTSAVPTWISDWAAELRRSSSPGKYLAVAETRTFSTSKEQVVFNVGGGVVESIDRASTYDRIVIPGAHGDTVFRLRNGLLTVVSSSCRHELCKKCGSVGSGRIICAPNRLVATIGDPFADIDTVTG